MKGSFFFYRLDSILLLRFNVIARILLFRFGCDFCGRSGLFIFVFLVFQDVEDCLAGFFCIVVSGSIAVA